jgi:general secretion pathway protein A
MLEAFFGLTGRPFDKSIKPDQLFMSNGVKELFSRLEYMKQHRGIMLISGQPGTGKTTALRAFVNGLSQLSYQSFYVPLATVNVLDFYRQLNNQLGGEPFFFKAQLFVTIQKSIKDLVSNVKKYQ